MNSPRSLIQGRARWLCWLVGIAQILIFTVRLTAADPVIRSKKIEPPAKWNTSENVSRWIRSTEAEWLKFQNSLTRGEEASPAPAPVIVDAVYQARFDGQTLSEGMLNWKIDRISQTPGFVSLGQSSLAVSQLRWGNREAVHGITSTGDWVLWSEIDESQLSGRWTQRGENKLSAFVFEMSLPRSLSSRLEIKVPSGWVARVHGSIGPETPGELSVDGATWKFELGRQQKFQLLLSQPGTGESPRILVRESTVYGLNNTDDVIRLQTDLECTVAGAKNADLLLAVPKTLRVFNVMLGNELPLTFERELGGEEDRVRIPLRSLTPGQRVSLRILGEAPRRSDREFPVPRLRPVDAFYQEGNIRLAVFRPLEVRSVEIAGLRQIQLTEEEGQEIRVYEVLSNQCSLSMQVGEPTALLQGEVLFIADVRGESPTSRVRMRLSTREGELYSPHMQIPEGWDLISVDMAESSDIRPNAWQLTQSPNGDNLLDIELRQPIRPDRDCTLLMEFKSVALKPGAARRLPIPRLVDPQSCFVRGVVWDTAPWELDESSTGTVELDSAVADPELIQAVKWAQAEDSRATPTGIRITGYNSQVKTLFRVEGSSPVKERQSSGMSTSEQGPSLLCANLELETRTSRVGTSHPHRAQFQFTRPTIPGEFRLTLPLDGELTRMIADEREISFVRRGSEVILDPAAKPFSRLVLEYRTPASAGWIVSPDEVVFPQLSCFVTEFAWHLVLDPERMLYRLPITAAVSPRDLPQTWERLLGPLARHTGEKRFNPLSREDWTSLINGTVREGTNTPPQDSWFVASHTPDRILMKTWKLDVSHGLAWCAFLGFLVCGIWLRRARRSWFRRGWIYLGGIWLVLAVFVAEPYAPIAGGAFLGTILAIIVPRRLAIGDTLTFDSLPDPAMKTGTTVVVTGCLIGLGIHLLSITGHGQEAESPSELTYFEVEEAGQRFVLFDAAFRSEWNAWREQESGPSWLLKSSRYDVRSEVSGPPRITATYQVTVFGDLVPAMFKLPLNGISLDQVEGMVDGQSVRLIPAADRQGFVLPLGQDKNDQPPTPPNRSTPMTGPRPATNRTITLKFRPLPESLNDDQTRFSAVIPALPESNVVFHSDRWRLTSDPVAGTTSSGSEVLRTVELGPSSRLNLQTGPASLSPQDNLADVQIRTLAECGPLGARLQVAILPLVTDSLSPAEVVLALPPGIFVQSVTGPPLEISDVSYFTQETQVSLRLRPTRFEDALPVEIVAFLPAGTSGFQIAPPRWKSSQRVPTNTSPSDAVSDSRLEKSLIGVIARAGFRVADASHRATIIPLSPQAFSDSVFNNLAWQPPDLAWSCRDIIGPAWTIESIPSVERGSLIQTITLKVPQSDWRLEASVTTDQGVPFEHRFTLDRRIEIHRASVQQDGADRLLHWTRLGDELRLSVRDGQPGTQTILIDGTIAQGNAAWAPPVCEYKSGQTVESSVIVRNSSRVASTLRWADSTTRLRPHSDQTEEEVRYRPGTPTAPLNIRVDPVVDERSARVWIDLLPQRDRSWQVTLRAQLKDNQPFAAPVRIIWDQPGLTEFTNPRDNVRQTNTGKGLVWRPQNVASKPAELTLSAAIDENTIRTQPLRLPQLSGIAWSEIWVSLPKGSGYRPARSISALLPTIPSVWPTTWVENLTNTREDLYSCNGRELTIETTASEPVVRPIRAETVIWMDGAENVASTGCSGITKYLLIAERDTNVEIPQEVRTLIRAIAIDGHTQPVEAQMGIPSRANDLSHEIVVWWQTDGPPPESLSGDLIRLPGTTQFPHWIGVIPPHQQVLLDLWGSRTSLLHEFWLDRAETILKGAAEFQGAPWSVDGPLLSSMSDTNREIQRITDPVPGEKDRLNLINIRWKVFAQSGGSITSPPVSAVAESQFSGLDEILALCGESRSLWLSSDKYPYSGPRLLDRKWAIAITASLASVVSLLLLTWIVSLFRRLDVAEKLAVHPYATMVALGLVWWIFLSPSVLGLGIVASGIAMAIRDRVHLSHSESQARAAATAAESPA